uniref:Xenopsin n=1 Tax=Prostheceraeus crozeri TaxID=2291463 RepID=A0A5C2Q6K2_9PLAT|nr:xenopsin [Maritigrella crozieri]
MFSINDTGPRIIGPYSYGFSLVLGIILLLIWICGLSVNGLILLTFAKNRKMRSPTNMFIITLCVNDLTLAFFGHPMDFVSAFSGRWRFGNAGCIFYGFAMFFTGLNCISLLTAISFDRYIIIAKPLYASKITKRVAGIALIACTCYSLIWTVPPLFGWNRYVMEGSRMACSVDFESKAMLDRSYQIAIFLACYFIPIAIILFSYYHVYMTVRHVAQNTTFGKESDVAKKNRKVEQKMFRTVVAMFCGFMIAWTPYAIVSMISSFGNPDVIPTMLTASLSTWAKASVVLDPSIYVFTNAQFRIAMAEHVPIQFFKSLLLPKEEEDDDDDDKKGGASAVSPQNGEESC